MDSVKLRVNLNEDDWQAYLLAAGQRMSGEVKSPASRLVAWLPSLFVLLLAALTVAAFATGRFARIALAALVGAMILLWLLRLAMRHSSTPSPEGLYLGPCDVEADPVGLSVRKTNYDARFAWTSASGVTVTDAHVFIWLDRMSGQTIPIRDLPPGITPDVLERTITPFIEKRANAARTSLKPPEDLRRSGSPEAETLSSVEADTPLRSLPSVLTELGQLVRLLFLGKVRPDLLYGRDLTIALCAIGAIAAHILLERAAIEGEARFFGYNIPSFGLFICIGLALAWLMARLSRPPVVVRRTLLLTSGFALFATIALGIGGLCPPPGIHIATGIVLAEFVMFFGRGLRVIAGKPRSAAVAAGLAMSAALAWLNMQFYLAPTVWFPPDPDEGMPSEFSQERHQLAFEQALLIERRLTEIQRAPTDEAQFFFIGFAGYGEQRVFSEEIQLAARQFDDRFGTGDRSLLLINDRRDLERFPWASGSALRTALRGLSRTMDVERDVLVLSLSSHGGQDGSLTINDGRLFTPDLPPQELADMLRDSGIRWKVVIVSACHAGAFIEPLRDDYTIVLTAAAEDRSSFGCSDDRDLTYFGEAFYRDALPTASSLREAFESAREAIERREDEEGISASRPQAHFGSEIEKKLSGMVKGNGNGV